MSRTLDTQAEYGVIAALLNDASCFDRVSSVVTPKDFSATTNRTLYSVIASMILACKPVDVLTVLSQLKAQGIETIDASHLLEIAQSAASPRHAKRYAEAVRIASLERHLRAAIAQADEIVEGDGDLSERTEAIAALFSGIAHRPNRRAPRHVS